MSLSETCIRRPVLTTLVTASIIVLGVFAYRLLSVAALPAVDFPTIAITATLPGASAETMAASVAAPIERQLSIENPCDAIRFRVKGDPATHDSILRVTDQFETMCAGSTPAE